jgi:hypothetical protein
MPFMAPVGTSSSSFDDGGKLLLPYSMMTLLSFPTLFWIAWKYEPTAFFFLMSITIRSLLAVFYACTAPQLSCVPLFCAAANSII